MKVHQAKRHASFLPELIMIISLMILIFLLLFSFSKNGLQTVLKFFGGIAEEHPPSIVYQLTGQQETGARIEVDNSLTVQEERQISAAERNLSTRIYFVVFNELGQLQPLGIMREVAFRQSPLTRTIETLLQGPSPSEINQGVHTMIPETSQLLSATLRDRVAVFDFNEAFYKNINVANVRWAQLRQIVFTATEFDGVNTVQFLEDGQIVDTWGSISLKEALSQADFF